MGTNALVAKNLCESRLSSSAFNYSILNPGTRLDKTLPITCGHVKHIAVVRLLVKRLSRKLRGLKGRVISAPVRKQNAISENHAADAVVGLGHALTHETGTSIPTTAIASSTIAARKRYRIVLVYLE